MNSNKWLVNLSSRTLSNQEAELLSKGLNFSLGTNVNIPDLLASAENVIARIDSSFKHKERTDISKCILSSNCSATQTTSHNLNILKSLGSDNSLVITKADKGRITVIMDKD